MAKFVQLSDEYAFNPDHILEVTIDDTDNCVTVNFIAVLSTAEDSALHWRDFVGDERKAFLAWWEHKAEVYRAG